MSKPDDLRLDTRAGLPDALRVLLADYPREAWEMDPGFHGLVSFWLERHLMFRRLSGLLREDAERVLDGDADRGRYGTRVGRYGSMLVNELHGHHTIEDQHYFPVLAAREPRIERGFAILDRDHKDLDGFLAAFVEAANGAVRAAASGEGFRDAAAAFHGEVLRLDRLLDRHLTDEEELVVPVILRDGPRGLG